MSVVRGTVRLFVVCSVTALLTAGTAGMCLDPRDAAVLKDAGVEDDTIRVLIEEKSIETCSLTVDEILTLKRAGVKGEALRGVVKARSFMGDTAPTVYGRAMRSVRSLSVDDIIRLRDAGVSDEVIGAALSGPEDPASLRDAYELLRHMGLVVDGRNTNSDSIP